MVFASLGGMLTAGLSAPSAGSDDRLSGRGAGDNHEAGSRCRQGTHAAFPRQWKPQPRGASGEREDENDAGRRLASLCRVAYAAPRRIAAEKSKG
jgi:hypothetical protein